MNIRNEDGYTLLELMVVILIVGILVSLAMVTYAGVQNSGYDTEAKANLHNGVTAAKAYFTTNESSFAGLDAATMALEVPGINFRNGDNPADTDTVYLSGVSASGYTLRVLSQSGTVYTAIGNNLSVTTSD